MHADLQNVLTEDDRRDISLRDYAPVMRRLLDRHTAAVTRAEKDAISRVGMKLSAAFKVVSQYRAVIAAEKKPVLRLRDGRTTFYAFTALPALHARSVVDYARKSREVSNLDLAFFRLIDGDAFASLDHVLAGKEIRPEARPYLDEIVEAVLAQGTDRATLAARLEPVRAQLPAAAAARLEEAPD